MRKYVLSAIALALSLNTLPAIARSITVEVTNLTNAIYFTPLIIAAHRGNANMFSVGQPASEELRAIAEGGDISGMQTQLEKKGAVVSANPANGLLAPGQTATADMEIGNARRLSIAAMLLPTNDGFVGLDSQWLGNTSRRVVYLYGYDAGTEDNDELLNPGLGGEPGVAGIPGDPSGLAGDHGTGVTGGDKNNTVHIHRGILGDDDPSGGISDLNRSAHRWLNPVARVVITRGE